MRKLLKDTTLEVIRAISPLVVVVIVLQFTLVKASSGVFTQFLIGAVMVIAGMVFFLLGIEVGILPVGKTVGAGIAFVVPIERVVGVAHLSGNSEGGANE